MFWKRQFSTIFAMDRFTPKQRAEIVTLYIENSRSIVLTQRAYRKKYRGKKAPSDNTIRRFVSNFFEHGTVGDRQHVVHQRPRRSNDLVEAVRESVAQDPTVSYRRRAQHFRVSKTTMWRILRKDLSLFPYKVQLTQKILPTDCPRCLEYGQTIAFLQGKFPGRLVSKRGDIDWPPRSPDLTPPDFFLWGYLKSKVYANQPQTIDELKANIRAEIDAITPEMLGKVMANAEKRSHFVIANKGGHLIDIVFKN